MRMSKDYWVIWALRFVTFAALLEGVRAVMTHPLEWYIIGSATACATGWTLADKAAASVRASGGKD